MPGSRPERVGDQIRAEISQLLLREVKDPGIGFVTVTRVRVSPDLQLARVFYTTLGDPGDRRATARALKRANPFLRRQLASRLRLRRAPEIVFHYDEAIEQEERIEQLLEDIRRERPDGTGDDEHPTGTDGD